MNESSSGLVCRVWAGVKFSSAFSPVLATGGFQILVTDSDMPGFDGAALCRQAREARLPGYLYILVLTAHTGASDTVAGLEAGADDYGTKPADERELLARVKAGRRIWNWSGRSARPTLGSRGSC